jgi:TetR/AcrR family transcriptional repressor of nem operon
MGQFASKDDLAAETTARVLARKDGQNGLPGKRIHHLARWSRVFVGASTTADETGTGCMLAAVGSDVVRRPRRVRHAFTEGLRARVDALRKLLPGVAVTETPEGADRDGSARRRATLSAAVDDPEFADEILEAVATIARGPETETAPRLKTAAAPADKGT